MYITMHKYMYDTFEVPEIANSASPLSNIFEQISSTVFSIFNPNLEFGTQLSVTLLEDTKF